MKRALFAVMTLLTLAGSCDTNGDGGGGGGGGGHAGDILEVFTRTGFVGSSEASPGDGIATDTAVHTDDLGTLRFDVDGQLDRCKLFVLSRVRVRPPGDIALRLKAGKTWCSKQPDATLEIRLETVDALIQMNDPVFGAEIIEGGSIVKVALGFVAVTALDDFGEAVIVGPGQQIFVPSGQQPESPVPLIVEGDEADEVDFLVREAPQPDLSPPDETASPVLARIRERGSILVGLDSPRSVEGSDGFILAIMNALANEWDLGGVEPSETDVVEGQRELDAGEIDVLFTPEPSEGQEVIAVFQDPTGQVWSLVLAEGDDAFADAMARFLVGFMTNGDYAAAFRESFGVEPNYQAVQSLLGF